MRIAIPELRRQLEIAKTGDQRQVMDLASDALYVLPDLLDEIDRLRLGLRNVLALAQRMRRQGQDNNAGHLIRFCKEAGIEPSILRGDKVVSDHGSLSCYGANEYIKVVERERDEARAEVEDMRSRWNLETASHLEIAAQADDEIAELRAEVDRLLAADPTDLWTARRDWWRARARLWKRAAKKYRDGDEQQISLARDFMDHLEFKIERLQKGVEFWSNKWAEANDAKIDALAWARRWKHGAKAYRESTRNNAESFIACIKRAEYEMHRADAAESWLATATAALEHARKTLDWIQTKTIGTVYANADAELTRVIAALACITGRNGE